MPLDEAVTSGRAYFVVPRPDLLVVDADLPQDPALAADRLASFDLLVEAADRCGVAHVVVASGRPGHRHGYLLLPAGRARSLVEQWCRDRGLDVRDRGVRPPGAPHRDGVHVAVPLSPRTGPEVLEVLSGPVDTDAASRLAHRLMPVQLPARVQSALRHGHEAAAYESPSHARMALAVAIRSRQGPRVLLEMLLGDRSSPLGRTYRARPGRWQQQEVRRLWDKAGDWIQTRPTVGPVALLVDRYEMALDANQWRGMAGGTDLAVAEAFAALSRRVGSVTVGFALADLGVAAGISQDTARAAVRRLVSQGWLRVVAEATPRTSRVYRLTIPAGAVVDEAPQPRPGRESRAGLSDLGQDLARWRALGKVSMRVARTLAGKLSGAVFTDGPERDVVRRLAATLAMRPAAVRYHLRKLRKHGLLPASGWVVVAGREDLDDLADHLGVAGRREQQATLVREQRARRAEVLAAYRTAWQSGRRAALAKHGLNSVGHRERAQARKAAGGVLSRRSVLSAPPARTAAAARA